MSSDSDDEDYYYLCDKWKVEILNNTINLEYLYSEGGGRRGNTEYLAIWNSDIKIVMSCWKGHCNFHQNSYEINGKVCDLKKIKTIISEPSKFAKIAFNDDRDHIKSMF